MYYKKGGVRSRDHHFWVCFWVYLVQRGAGLYKLITSLKQPDGDVFAFNLFLQLI